ALADRDFALGGVSLAHFIERHHHRGSAISPALAGELEERPLALLHRDRVDDRLARHAFEAGFDHAPFRAVDHHRHARDIRFGGDALQKGRHRRFGVEQSLVHVDVDDLRPVLDLVASDLDRGVIVAGEDQLLEARRAGDVAALANVDEARAYSLSRLRERMRKIRLVWRRAVSRMVRVCLVYPTLTLAASRLSLSR